MLATKFAQSPYYEILENIQQFQKLFINVDAPLDIKGRHICSQMVEFVINNNQNILLTESKRQKASNLDIRIIIRFCKFGGFNNVDLGPAITDQFPLHLQLDLNGSIIQLPNFLPNDRCGKDGRRFPRPIDITEGLIVNPAIVNRMIINWVHDDTTTGDYYFSIFLVRLRSWDELTRHLLNNYVSAVATTLRLIYGQSINANGTVDEDLLLTDTVITASLCCPVSRGRMIVPIRGKNCTHLQCFDGTTYLMMNFKKPTWLCPVCDQVTPFTSLEVDGLIYNILQDDRSKNVDTVQFNKSNQWRPERNIPGQSQDDQPFYEITEYLRQSQSSAIINPPPITTSNENVVQVKEEKTVNHLLISSKTQAIIQSQQHDHNSSRDTSVHSRTANVDYTSYETNKPTIGSSMPQGNINDNCDIIPPYISASTKDYVTTCNQRPPITSDTDSSMTLRITDVKSMAPKKTLNEDVMKLDAIICEDMKNSDFKSYVQVDISKTTQKRPLMVSSVPSEAVSSKQMKLTDNHMAPSARPMSAFVNDPRLQALSKLCNCTPGRLCPYHNSATGGYYHQMQPVNGGGYINMGMPPQYSMQYAPSPVQYAPPGQLQSPVLPQQGTLVKKGVSRAKSTTVPPSVQSQSQYMNYQYPMNVTPQSYMPPYRYPSPQAPPHNMLPPANQNGNNQSPLYVPNYPNMIQYPQSGYYSTNGTAVPNQNIPTNNSQNVYNVTCRNTSTEISVTHDPSQPNGSAVSSKSLPQQTATYPYLPGVSSYPTYPYQPVSSQQAAILQGQMMQQYPYSGYTSSSYPSPVVNSSNQVLNRPPGQSVQSNYKPNSNLSGLLNQSQRPVMGPDLNQSFTNDCNLTNAPQPQINTHSEATRQASNVCHYKISSNGKYQPPVSQANQNIPSSMHQHSQIPQDHYSTSATAGPVSSYPLSQKQWQQMVANYPSQYGNNTETALSNGSSGYLTSNTSSPLSAYNSLLNVYNA